jgi:hypothetical protein
MAENCHVGEGAIMDAALVKKLVAFWESSQ